jgi:transcriptional repressor NrdR
MRCGKCQTSDSKVIESRDVTEGEAIRRRRECLHCQHRFTTYERLERPTVIVIKNNGTRQVFSREKLLAGLQRACEKTTVSNMQLDAFVADIERELQERGEPEIPTSEIGELVMERLATLNEVAYVRFASVYRRFKDIKGFETELSRIRDKQKA